MSRRATWCAIRRNDSSSLHALATRLQRQFMTSELSAGQERMFDQIIAELEWRSVRKRRQYKRCACQFCHSPFPQLTTDAEDQDED